MSQAGVVVGSTGAETRENFPWLKDRVARGAIQWIRHGFNSALRNSRLLEFLDGFMLIDIGSWQIEDLRVRTGSGEVLRHCDV